jgi:hypothetical protein
LNRIFTRTFTKEDVEHTPPLGKEDLMEFLKDKPREQDENMFYFANNIAHHVIGNKARSVE